MSENANHNVDELNLQNVGIDIKDKWRLILGQRAESELPLDKDQPICCNGSSSGMPGEGDDELQQMRHNRFNLGDLDQSLNYIYEEDDDSGQEQGGRKTRGGKEGVRLTASKWLNTTRQLFPENVYEVIQKDALSKGRIAALLQDDSFVAKLEPNMDLLSTILTMHNQLNGHALDNARILVDKIVERLKEHFNLQVQRAFFGKRDPNAQPVRTFRNLDIRRIIRANLKNYQEDGGYIIPKQLYFKANSVKRPLHHLFVVVDQSGSMMDSYAHSAILASIFSKLSCLETRLICYSTTMVDYSAYLDDVVALLFKSQLGGGTDTCPVLAYVEREITEPHKSIVVLITDLYDSEPAKMVKMTRDMIESGVKFIVLPALGSTSPSYSRHVADQMAGVGAHVGVLSPDRLIEFVAQIVNRG